jgi:5-methylthioadenosine/S-adenosylhomocysteine deaminase
MTTANDAELDIVAAARTPVVVCGRVQAALGNGVPPIVEFDRRGIPVAFATDNAMLASPNLLDELKYMSRVTRATTRNPSLPTPRDLIAGVTTVAAETLKLDDRLGSIECGKAASFIVFDLRSDNLNPTRDLLASIVTRADATDIAAVVNHGFVVAGAMPVREHVSPLPSLNGGMPAG